VHRDVAHDDEARSVTREPRSKFERIRGARSCTDQDCVEPEFSGQPAHSPFECDLVPGKSLCSSLAGEFDRGGIEVDPDRGASRCTEQPDRELAHKAQADYTHIFTDRRFTLSHPVKRDCTHCRVRGILEGDTVRHAGDEVSRHSNDLGVIRPTATASDSTTRRKALDLRGDSENRPCRGVAKRSASRETVSCCVERRPNTLHTRFVDDFPNEIWPRTCLLHEVLAAEFDLAAFGPGTYQRKVIRHEQPPRPNRWQRHLHDGDLAVSWPLSNLLHNRAAAANVCRTQSTSGKFAQCRRPP
jgi:hypothetical protein